MAVAMKARVMASSSDAAASGAGSGAVVATGSGVGSGAVVAAGSGVGSGAVATVGTGVGEGSSPQAIKMAAEETTIKNKNSALMPNGAG